MKGHGPFPVEDIIYPMTSIGAVMSQEGTIGTGCLIGPNIVLTCAHNCYHEIKGIPLTEITFIPAHIKKLVPEFLGFKTKYIYYPNQYKEAAKNFHFAVCYDYAVLILDYEYPGCDMFDEKKNFEFYFGSLGYDFDWESNCSQ